MVNSRNAIRYSCVFAGIVAGILLSPTTALATSWLSTQPNIVIEYDQPGAWDCPDGTVEQVRVTDWNIDSAEEDACVVHGNSVDLAYFDWHIGFPSGHRAVQVHGDGVYRVLNSRVNGNLIAGTDTYVFTTIQNSLPGDTRSLFVTYDLHSSLIPYRVDKDGKTIAYSIDQSKATALLADHDSNSTMYDVRSFAMSSNGRYAVVYMAGIVGEGEYVKVDMQTKEVTALAPLFSSVVLPETLYEHNRVKAVSNDGKYALIGPSARIIETSGCGVPFTGTLTLPDVFLNTCKIVDISPAISDKVGYEFETKSDHFIDDNTLSFISYRERPNKSDRVTLSPGEKIDVETRIDYLALGDSYSSGEGDVANSNYYIKGTDDAGMCHLSSRSYPYTLSYLWGYQKEGMSSVACSGAIISADYMDSIDTYQGQHKELAELSVDDRRKMIDKALTDMKPGIIPQIEFVKKYKPSVVTLTGGGNDVGFVKVLQYCAGDIKETATNSTHTCEYVDGGKLHTILNDSIDTQYGKIKELIQKIKTASPGVKIYYIGYPSFIAGSDEICGYNNGALNSEERNMINQAVKRLNHTIKQAAASEDVQYIDIEEALDGGRLCESEKYITGVLDDGALKPDHYGAFHPNAAGHAKITEAIITQVPRASINYAPTVSDPNVITIEPGIPTERGRIVKDSTVAEGEMLIITLEPNTSATSTDIIAAGFSSPTQLGVFRSNTDGSLNAQVKLPSTMSEGRHLLLLEFVDPEGHKKRLYEFIEIVATSQNDEMGYETPEQVKVSTQYSWSNLLAGDTVKSSLDAASNGFNDIVWARQLRGEPSSKKEKAEKSGLSFTVWATALGAIIIGGVWVYGKKR